MEGDFFDSELQKFFPGSSQEDWKKMAVQETGGKEPFEFLLWQGKDGIPFLPYYDSLKDAQRRFLQSGKGATADDSHTRTWRNLPRIKVSAEQMANALALDHLMNGADGVWFDVQAVDAPDVKALINNIEWPYCSIEFFVTEKNSRTLLEALPQHMTGESGPALLNGALFWESVPKSSELKFYFEQCENFYALGLLIPESAPAAEISEALMRGVIAIENFSAGASIGRVFRSIAFSLPANASFLQCCAKFRALRMLWWQVSRAYGIDHYSPHDLHIHARSEAIADLSLGPHENMLKGTFAAMAAVLGGCDSITVEEQGTAPFASRWARNVSSILREESFLDQARDPLMGAWALDALTNDIAQKAWQLFQQKSKDHAAT